MTVLKKAFDSCLSIVCLVFALPVMLLIGLFVYLDSPGNVIFSQARLGRYGKPFFMHKFRKFPVDWGSTGPGVTTSGDVRMTRVGRVLERTKLDELPQLWNILKGEMSFVGPRPESLRYKELFVGKYKQVLDFVPGIFGPNQVAFRNEARLYPGDMDPDEFYQNQLFPQKAMADIDYFTRSTFFSDLAWLARGLYGTLSGVVDWEKFIQQHLFVILIDIVLIEFAWAFAHWFRFGLSILPHNITVFLTGCWILPLIIMPIMMMGGCYRHPVRYFSLSDVIRLILVTSSAWTFSILIVIGFFHRNMSIALALLGLILLLSFLILPRVWRREMWLNQHHRQNLSESHGVIVYGADIKGNALVKFLDQAYPNVKIVGYIDEDEDLRGRYINGYKVLGTWRDLDVIVHKMPVTEFWISQPIKKKEDVVIQSWADRHNIKPVFLYNIDAFSSLE